MADDIMDGAITRYGKPSWYTLDDIKLTAVNDSSLMHEAIYYLIHTRLVGKSYYTQILRLLNEVISVMLFGQMLDNSIAGKDVLKYNMDFYQQTLEGKAIKPLIYLPVKAAMYVSG